MAELEYDACVKLATIPMKAINRSYQSQELVETLIHETGQRPNLIALACHLILSQLEPTERVIKEKHLEKTLDLQSMRDGVKSGLLALTENKTENKTDRLILDTTAHMENFTLSQLKEILHDQGHDRDTQSLERSLDRLELAFALKREKNRYSYRVPLFQKIQQEK